MANKFNSLSHTKWLCKYHIVIVPKYRRKVIYKEYRKDLQEIIKTLCKYKGVEIPKVEYPVEEKDIEHELGHMQEHMCIC